MASVTGTQPRSSSSPLPPRVPAVSSARARKNRALKRRGSHRTIDVVEPVQRGCHPGRVEGLPHGPQAAVCRRRLEPEREPGLLEGLAHGRGRQRAGARRRARACKPRGDGGPELRRRAHPAVAGLDAATGKHVLVRHEDLAAGPTAHQDLGPICPSAHQNQGGSVFGPGAAAAHAIGAPPGVRSCARLSHQRKGRPTGCRRHRRSLRP